MIFLQLFWEFFKTGLFSIGGGLATLPFLYEMGERTGWFTAQQVADMLAVSESTPGPIGVNMAVYTGYTSAGVFGSVCALVGLVMPSVIIIILVAAALKAFRSNFYVNGAFYGIRPASTGLIAAAGLTVAVQCMLHVENWQGWNRFWVVLDWRALALGAAVFIVSRLHPRLHPIFLILGCAAIGIVFRFAGV